MTAKKALKNYEKAYQDKLLGMTYEQIAKKYKVTKSAVQAWQRRYWHDWNSVRNNTHDGQLGYNGGNNGQIDGQQPSFIRPNIAQSNGALEPIISKQLKETDPAKLYAEYSRDNLPELEPKQARFVEEYLIDLDKTAAAIRASYSVKNASVKGCQLYANPAINAHIQVALAERRKRTGVNVDTTIREMARIAYANPAKVVADDGSILEDASEDDLRAIAGVKIKTTHNKDGSVSTEREIKFCDKNKALEMLARHQGMFVDKSLVVTANAGDLSQLPTDALEAELKKQLGLSQTINVTPSHADTEDNE